MLLSKQIQIPGKITLAGEHAVIYGAQGLTAIIDQHCHFKLSQQNIKTQHVSLHNFQVDQSFSWDQITSRANVLKQRWLEFRCGLRPIKKICDNPFDLIIACLNEVKTMCPTSQQHGHHLWIQSDIPTGLGLGSSAAIIVGVLRIFCQLYDIPYQWDDLENRAKQIESLQHGKSSGIDIATCHRNQALHFTENPSSLTTPIQLPITLVNTGESGDSTGQCVSIAKQYWNNSRHLRGFNACTQQLINAIKRNQIDQAHQAIRNNHYLLCELGVVPFNVQCQIKQLEDRGFSAKICGAGGVSNEHAGIIMVLGEHFNSSQLKQTPYTIAPFCLSNTPTMVSA